MTENIIAFLVHLFSGGKSYLIFISFLLALLIGMGSVIFTKQNDNPIEEIAERVIEIDLNLPKGSVNLDLPMYSISQ